MSPSKTVVRATDGEGEKLTEEDGLGVADGEAVADTDSEGLGEIPLEALCDPDTEEDGLAEADGLAVALGEADGLPEEEGEIELEGEKVVKPSSSSACPALNESTRLRMSKFFPILKEPGIPLSS